MGSVWNRILIINFPLSIINSQKTGEGFIMKSSLDRTFI
jgi:hypothetical protein